MVESLVNLGRKKISLDRWALRIVPLVLGPGNNFAQEAPEHCTAVLQWTTGSGRASKRRVVRPATLLG